MIRIGKTDQQTGALNTRFTRQYLTRTVALVLGALFLLSGVSKSFALGAFARTVASITLLPQETAWIAAFVIVAMEILGALMLFSGRRTRLIAVLFTFLVAGFITVLTLAILQRREIACNCFGILGLRLSNLHELLLDLVLFNSFLMLAIFAGQVSSQSKISSRTRRPAGWTPYIAGGLILEFLLMFPVVSKALGPETRDYESVLSFAEHADTLFAQHSSHNRVLLLLSYSDFSCPICFDDFSALADSLGNRFGEGQSHNIVALLREGTLTTFDAPDRLEHWIEANHIRFPVFLTPADTFQTIRFVKSMAVVLDPDDQILFSEIFPMGETKRSAALRLLENHSMN